MPESLPLTEESQDRLREQANQPEPTVLRLVDLLAVVVEDERQGGDRLPLELALVKVTRPQSIWPVNRLSIVSKCWNPGCMPVFRRGVVGPLPVPAPAAGPALADAAPPPSEPGDEEITVEQVHEAWTRSVIPAVKERSIPVASLLSEANPTALEGNSLTLSFQPSAEFHRKQVDDPKNLTVLRDALYEVTGGDSRSSPRSPSRPTKP